jgi:carbonic anhydrase/acetyltransferase-like protein (isoleucine patch superfamily)
VEIRLVRRRRVIAPFGLEVDDCGLGMATFGDWRAGVIAGLGDARDAGVDEPIDGPALVWSDDVWVTRRALRGFLREASRATEPTRLCLPRSRLLELFLPLQDVEVDKEGRAAFDVGFIPAGARASPAEVWLLPPHQWCAPPYKEIALEVPAPRYILRRDSPTLTMPLTSTVAMRIRHWVHVLRAGHLAPQVTLLERATSQPIRSAMRGLLSARITKAARLRALRARFSYRGRGTFVHPTATVEASVLGDGVSVGAYSYVTHSVVGAGSVIEQRAHVSGCSLGPRTFVSLNSSLQACVTFGDTDACINGVQACVIAQRCALTSFARPLDLAVEGPVRVEDEGRLREAGELPCGVAFGPGVFVGADVVIAAGRAIPRDVRLFADGSGVLQKVPADLQPGNYAVVDGRPLM